MRHHQKKDRLEHIKAITPELMTAISPPPRAIYILGAGGFLNDLMELVGQYPEYTLAGILDPYAKLRGQSVHGVPILGWLADLPAEADNAIIGTPACPGGFDREALFYILLKRGISLPILKALSCQQDMDVTLPQAVLLLPHCLLESGCKIGENCLIGPNAVLGRAAALADHATVAAGEKISCRGSSQAEPARPKSLAATIASCHENIQEIIRRINWASMEIILLTDDTGCLVGTITDGDIRRGMLTGIDSSLPASVIMNPRPVTVPLGTSHQDMLNIMKKHSVTRLPVVDNMQRPVRLEILQNLLREDEESGGAVVMAGGLGSRLGILTKDTPKPLINVGGKPILDHVLEGLSESGLSDVVISVNYLADKIQDHVGDGSRHDLHVSYQEERHRLGTAGALSLLRPRPRKPFLVINADLLTGLDFSRILRFRRKRNYDAVICVRSHKMNIQYGVVDICNSEVTSLKEKPVYQHFINAGIYVLDPACIDLVPPNRFFDMPDLINTMLAKGCKIGAFPIIEYWRDIGTPTDLSAASRDLNIAACY